MTKPSTAPQQADAIEITNEMVRAGLEVLKASGIADRVDDTDALLVRDILEASANVVRSSRGIPPVVREEF